MPTGSRRDLCARPPYGEAGAGGWGWSSVALFPKKVLPNIAFPLERAGGLPVNQVAYSQMPLTVYLVGVNGSLGARKFLAIIQGSEGSVSCYLEMFVRNSWSARAFCRLILSSIPGDAAATHGFFGMKRICPRDVCKTSLRGSVGLGVTTDQTTCAAPIGWSVRSPRLSIRCVRAFQHWCLCPFDSHRMKHSRQRERREDCL